MPKTITQRSELTKAVYEVAKAIHAIDQAQERQAVASSLRALGHLTFGGLVLAQVFSERLDYFLVFVGIAFLALSYGVARQVARGGERT